jgi:hypothetical protein
LGHARIKRMPVRHGGRPLHKPKPSHRCEQLFRGNFVLAGNPCWRPLIFSAISDLAFFAAGDKLKNNHFGAVEASPSVILGGGKDQPMSFQNFVCAVLGKDLITPIRIHFDGRSRAMLRLSSDFDAHAFIGSRKGCLRPRRRAAEEETDGAHNDYSS